MSSVNDVLNAVRLILSGVKSIGKARTSAKDSLSTTFQRPRTALRSLRAAMATPSPVTDFAAYVTALQSALELTTKRASALPGPSDLSFHRSLDRSFARGLDASSARVLGQANRLLSTVAAAGSAKAKQKKRRELKDEDDVVDGFQGAVIDVMDELLEDADSCLDEFTGQKKAAAIEVKATSADPVKRVLPASHTPTSRLPFNLLHDASLRKPQLDFTPPVDNSNDATWSPTLPTKHHAMVPLEASSVNHPYAYESAHIPYPTSMFTQAPPIPVKPFASTPFTFVNTREALQELIEKLKQAKEIAVDLEHHSFRSYAGFVCLMQISTRDEDWVVDTLALRNELRETKLGGVFADPSVVKVFHGAESDIVWLQQDFDIYVVNLFDTYHASKVLEFPSFSLASLLSLYCDFTADKRYQMADWRIRPIPEEMLFYARTDTHFLLYIYDNLRNSLLSRSAPASPLHPSIDGEKPQPQASMRAVLERSEKTALKLYARERYDAETGLGGGGWASLLRKAGRALAVDLRKLEVFKAIHGWRDSVARAQDESPHYLMPNHQLFTLTAKQAQTPADILAYAKPLSPALRKKVHELAQVVQEAMRKPLAALKPVADKEVPVANTVTPAPTQSAVPVGRKLDSAVWESQAGRRKSVGSSLFGKALPGKSTLAVSKSQSALFGAGLKKKKDTRAPTAKFNEVAQRVHKSFIPAPIPVQEPPSPQPAPTEPEQIPFVPAAERKPKDEIVAVGLTKKQRKQKKRTAPGDEGSPRKKTKLTPPGESPASSSTPAVPTSPRPVAEKKKGKNKVKLEEIPAFDYTQEPNGLDSFKAAPPTKLARKPKKPKGPIVDTSNFRKPPEDPSAPKAGSRSAVFKK